jgi:hypothetical protein
MPYPVHILLIKPEIADISGFFISDFPLAWSE